MLENVSARDYTMTDSTDPIDKTDASQLITLIQGEMQEAIDHLLEAEHGRVVPTPVPASANPPITG